MMYFFAKVKFLDKVSAEHLKSGERKKSFEKTLSDFLRFGQISISFWLFWLFYFLCIAKPKLKIKFYKKSLLTDKVNNCFLLCCNPDKYFQKKSFSKTYPPLKKSHSVNCWAFIFTLRTFWVCTPAFGY